MNNEKLKNVVIVGGGTAGWMSAAALVKSLGKNLNITLVESDQIGTVGVGEATIPTIQGFNKLLGVDEVSFMKATQSTFKLGIEFKNWGQEGDTYLHPFGNTGKECWAADFQHFWLKGLRQGVNPYYSDYCVESQAALAGKFAKVGNYQINYAYHIDATLYAKFLRGFSEDLGVNRVEGKISSVCVDDSRGFVQHVELEDGRKISGDLFIDCSGFRGLLIEQALHTGYEDWSHFLPCDRAVAVPSKKDDALVPYTRAMALESGWQWRIPLQHRTGNGLVFCSKYMSTDEAQDVLVKNLDTDALAEPREVRFKTGRRLKGWNKNCVAIGLSSGFIEPLESTSIHLIMTAILRLIKLFPLENITPTDADEYNRQFLKESEQVRDFIILHYHINQKRSSPFWRYCADMNVPDSLKHKINLFKDKAAIFRDADELFRIDSWAHVMLGQGISPAEYHPIVDLMPDKELGVFLTSLKSSVDNIVSQLPEHKGFVNKYCKAGELNS